MSKPGNSVGRGDLLGLANQLVPFVEDLAEAEALLRDLQWKEGTFYWDLSLIHI